MDEMLGSAEAAQLLGVKVSTLYAYVSRGILRSQRGARGHKSLYSVSELESFAARTRGSRINEPAYATTSTSETDASDAGQRYRGTLATELVHEPFESVADLLWKSPPGEWIPYRLTIPSEVATRDVVSVVAAMLGSFDALRSDRRPEAVVRAARRLIATVPESLVGERATSDTASVPIAERLAQWMVGGRPDQKLVAAVNATLVLLADNEESTPTVGVVLAASRHADLYDAVLAGLGILGGRLHGPFSELALKLLVDAAEHGADLAVDGALRWTANLPGFGSRGYPLGDPRFTALKPFLDDLLSPADREVLDSVVGVAARHELPAPNVDLAVAALVRSVGTDPNSGFVLLALARIAGWVAHYLEEIQEPDEGRRLSTIYVAPRLEQPRRP